MASEKNITAASVERELHREPTGQFGTRPHTEAGLIPAPAPDLRFDTSEWSGDLDRCIKAATLHRVSLDRDQLRRIATSLLHGYEHMRFPLASELRRTVLNGAAVDSDYYFDTDRWTGDLEEAILVETDGYTRLSDDELRGAVRLLIDAQEDEWEPCQAALLHAQHTADRNAVEQARRDTLIEVVCECGRTFTTISGCPTTHCTVCLVQALRDRVEEMKAARRDAELARSKPAAGATPITAPDGCAVCGRSAIGHGNIYTRPDGAHTWTRPTNAVVKARIQARRDLRNNPPA